MGCFDVQYYLYACTHIILARLQNTLAYDILQSQNIRGIMMYDLYFARTLISKRFEIRSPSDSWEFPGRKRKYASRALMISRVLSVTYNCCHNKLKMIFIWSDQG